LASHYYDPALHPTCAALRAGGLEIMRSLLDEKTSPDVAVELGAGRAIAPELLTNWNQIILMDSSPEMLMHSQQFSNENVTMLIADSAATGLNDGVADLVLSSLGDPYNSPALWMEIARILKPGGQAIFTTPSPQWASQFRTVGQDSPDDTSEFLLPDRTKVSVPSIIYSEADQVRIIEESGLTIVRVFGRKCKDVAAAAAAPKLAAVNPDQPYVLGYLARRDR
jgi:SAM-dependent methyltransferase